MTLLREIQVLLERTYGKTGVNLDEFVLTPQRGRTLSEMAGTTAAQISDLGRLFLRIVDGKLRMGIYYDNRVIDALERNNPQHGLTDDNVLPFMVFLEEIDHAVHAALKYREGVRNIYSEEFVRDLELQAKVDTYLVLQIFCAFFNPGQKLTESDRRWLKSCVFDSENFAYEEPAIAERYHETNIRGRRYVKFLETLTPARRTAEIRRFRKLTYQQKHNRIAAVAA